MEIDGERERQRERDRETEKERNIYREGERKSEREDIQKGRISSHMIIIIYFILTGYRQD